MVAGGLLLWVLVGGASRDVLERAGVAGLFALPVVAGALVSVNSALWRRPWLAILLSLVAYAAGSLLAVNVWMWLGLPH